MDTLLDMVADARSKEIKLLKLIIVAAAVTFLSAILSVSFYQATECDCDVGSGSWGIPECFISISPYVYLWILHRLKFSKKISLLYPTSTLICLAGIVVSPIAGVVNYEGRFFAIQGVVDYGSMFLALLMLQWAVLLAISLFLIYRFVRNCLSGSGSSAG
jgi:hypothetical protein